MVRVAKHEGILLCNNKKNICYCKKCGSIMRYNNTDIEKRLKYSYVKCAVCDNYVAVLG